MGHAADLSVLRTARAVGREYMRKLGMGVAMVAVFHACGSPTAPSPRLTLVVAPDPVSVFPVPMPCPTAGPCISLNAASWTLTTTSTVAGLIETSDVKMASDGTLFASWRYNAADIVREEGTNHIASRGALTMHQGLLFSVPAAYSGIPAIDVSVRFLPDSGGVVEQTVRASIY
jgi:hypothetical protein